MKVWIANNKSIILGRNYNVPICKEMHFGSVIDFIKQSGVRLIGCTEKANKPLFEVDMRGPVAIVMGSEESGIHEKTMEKLDEKALIPMVGKTASLNVSVATGMILYEVYRQSNN